MTIPGRTTPPDSSTTECLNVDPAFLDTMQIPVMLGRGLRREDLASPAVAVVNQKFASTFFPHGNPLGGQFVLGRKSGAALFTIVGESKNAHYNSLQATDEPVVYIPYTQDLAELGGMFFELRTAGDPFGAVGAVRRIVHDASRDVSITEVTTQVLRMEQTISQERTFANLGACFAVLALLIACVGLYGTTAYAVARRTREIGIRMALGAQRREIVAMVLRQVFALAAAGLLIGYGAAHFTTHLIESFLYGIHANDPLAMTAAIGNTVRVGRRHTAMTSREMSKCDRIEVGGAVSIRQLEEETHRALVSTSHLCLSVRFLATRGVEQFIC